MVVQRTSRPIPMLLDLPLLHASCHSQFSRCMMSPDSLRTVLEVLNTSDVEVLRKTLA